jgi:O-antigen ligase
MCVALLLLMLALNSGQNTRVPLVPVTAYAWLAAALLSAALGLLQYLGWTAWLGSWVNHPHLGEAYGNLRQRNQYATLMNLGLAALLWWRVQPLAAGVGRHGGVFAVLMALLLGAGNAASSSRTGLFQMLLVIGLALLWAYQARQTNGRYASTGANASVQPVLATVALGYVLASVALPWLSGLDPLTSGAWARLRDGDALCNSRLTLWGNVLHLIGQKPWLGWGWGELDYAHFITLYPGARFCDILDNAHNLPLHLAVELGVPLALLVCGSGLWLTWRAKPWRELDPTRQMAWAVVAVILLHSLLEYPLWYGPFQMALGLSLSFLWVQKNRLKQPFAQYLKAFIALFLIVFCLFAAWDYDRVSQIYLPPESRAPAYQVDTLEKIRDVRLFHAQAGFADLTTAELTPDNALALNVLAKEMLHFSPEARVAEMLINSARLLGDEAQVQFYVLRYKAAFPQAYAQWMLSQ